MSLKELTACIDRLQGLTVHDIPLQVRRRVGMLIADCLAVGFAGAKEPEIAALIADTPGRIATESSYLPGVRRVWGDEMRLEREASTTAFLNAAAGCSMELDEGIRPTGHPAMHVVPAVLAVADSDHTVDDIVRAVVIGYEIAASLFWNLRLSSGLHPHGGLGSIGAAVGASLLADADPRRAALVAATTPIVGGWTACYEGATARSSYMGYGASAGVRSAEMARAGFFGMGTELTICELGLATWREERVWWAGGDFACTAGYVKFHSACALAHTVIDAARRIPRLAATQLEHVLVEVNSNGTRLDRFPQDNRLSRLFSLQHAAASALVDPKFPVRTGIDSPTVREIASRITVAEDPSLTRLWPNHSAARVTVTTLDGLTETVELLDPDGYRDDGFIDEHLGMKFAELTKGWPLADHAWSTWAEGVIS